MLFVNRQFRPPFQWLGQRFCVDFSVLSLLFLTLLFKLGFLLVQGVNAFLYLAEQHRICVRKFVHQLADFLVNSGEFGVNSACFSIGL